MRWQTGCGESRSPVANRLFNRRLRLEEQSLPRRRGREFACDEQGMIVSQRPLAAYRMGAVGSDRCGCGWIACYNALRLLGYQLRPEQVIRALEPAFALRGQLGTRAAALPLFFLRRGFSVSVSAMPWEIARRAPGAQANILYYIRRPPNGRISAHFVAFSGMISRDAAGEPVYRFYNTLSAPVRLRRPPKGEAGPCFCAGGRQGDLRTLRQLLMPERPLLALVLSIRHGDGTEPGVNGI